MGYDVSDTMHCMQTGACNAEVERQQLVWEPAARAVLWTEVHAQCAQGMCSLELLLLSETLWSQPISQVFGWSNHSNNEIIINYCIARIFSGATFGEFHELNSICENFFREMLPLDLLVKILLRKNFALELYGISNEQHSCIVLTINYVWIIEVPPY